MRIITIAQRSLVLLGVLACCACGGAVYKPMVFHNGERQPMRITSGSIQTVRDVDIPVATWKTGAETGRLFGGVLGEAATQFGVGMPIILVGSALGGMIGMISDSKKQTLPGQELLFAPDSQGEASQLMQPNQGRKLQAGERIRIVEGSFVSRLERQE